MSFRHQPSLSLFRACVVALSLFVTACTPVQPASQLASATPTAAEAATPTAAEAAASDTVAITPVELRIAAINLAVPVTSMSWTESAINGQRTTVWVVPDDSAGWHVNSAQPGTAGNVVISGQQIKGAAVFAPIALGEVVAGQEIELDDSMGNTFVYKVTKVSEPLPITGATEAENAEAIAYVAPTTTGQLTLITGWPDFTTTHRVFVVAALQGPKP